MRNSYINQYDRHGLSCVLVELAFCRHPVAKLTQNPPAYTPGSSGNDSEDQIVTDWQQLDSSAKQSLLQDKHALLIETAEQSDCTAAHVNFPMGATYSHVVNECLSTAQKSIDAWARGEADSLDNSYSIDLQQRCVETILDLKKRRLKSLLKVRVEPTCETLS